MLKRGRLMIEQILLGLEHYGVQIRWSHRISLQK
jgi:hypothetical protein